MAYNMDSYRTLTPYLIVADADAESLIPENGVRRHRQILTHRHEGEVMHAELKWATR